MNKSQLILYQTKSISKNQFSKVHEVLKGLKLLGNVLIKFEMQSLRLQTQKLCVTLFSTQNTIYIV